MYTVIQMNFENQLSSKKDYSAEQKLLIQRFEETIKPRESELYQSITII